MVRSSEPTGYGRLSRYQFDEDRYERYERYEHPEHYEYRATMISTCSNSSLI